MLDFLHNTSFYLAVLSLITSLVTLLTLGHVTTLVQRLRNGNGSDKDLISLSEAAVAEELLNRELNLELGESGASGGGSTSMKMFSYVNSMSMWGLSIPDFRNHHKSLPGRTSPPSSSPSTPTIGSSYFSVLQRTEPKPVSMAKLIMSRRSQRKSPPRPRMPRQQPFTSTSLRHESRPISS